MHTEKTEGMLIDKTLLKFMIVGVINSIVGMGTMLVLYNVFHCSYWVSSAANYVVGSIVSYFLNRYFTFHYHGSTWWSIVRFTLNIIVCYLIAYSLAKPLMTWLLRNEPVAIQENVAMLTGFVLFIILNYAGQRFFAFRSKPVQEAKESEINFNESCNTTEYPKDTAGGSLKDLSAKCTDAYLILAHGHPEILARLVDAIDHPSHYIFIHIDARKDIETFREAVRVKHSPVCFIGERQRVVWGTYSVVRAEMALYGAATAQGPFAHYHLLSGTTMPLRSADDIHGFFEEHRGVEFLAFHDTPQEDIDYRQRYRYHGWAIRPDWPCRWLRLMVQRLSLRVQRLCGMGHAAPIALKKGSQWCSLTHEAVGVLLDRREEVERLFCHSLCPDELYKHSILCDSPRAAHLFDEGAPEGRSLQYIRFDSPADSHPHAFAIGELPVVAERLAGTPFLFARKFV